MPNHYQIETDAALLGRQLDSEWPTHPERPVWSLDVFPKYQAPTMVWEDGRRTMRVMQFGIVPFFKKEAKGKPLYNARWETIESKPSFHDGFRENRCGVPLRGFYEYIEKPPTPKQFAWFAPKGGPPAVAAGICTTWQGNDGTAITGFAIITRDPTEELAAVGLERMPVLLPSGAWDSWLDPAQQDIRELKRILAAYDRQPWAVENRDFPPRKSKNAAKKEPEEKGREYKTAPANMTLDLPFEDDDA